MIGGTEPAKVALSLVCVDAGVLCRLDVKDDVLVGICVAAVVVVDDAAFVGVDVAVVVGLH